MRMRLRRSDPHKNILPIFIKEKKKKKTAFQKILAREHFSPAKSLTLAFSLTFPLIRYLFSCATIFFYNLQEKKGKPVRYLESGDNIDQNGTRCPKKSLLR